MHFEFIQVGREWYWHLKARNGRILCWSGEPFKRFSGMLRNARQCFPDGMRRQMLERDLLGATKEVPLS